jgi:ABC-type phosphate transport system auxiliary subunit
MPMSQDLASLVQRIRSLLEHRGGDPTTPLLTAMEHTLTDGYARALELEGERLRLERRIGELAHRLDGPEQAGELRELAARLRSVDDDLASLRDALVPLQQRVDAARAAA